jgi:hypothetical protein
MELLMNIKFKALAVIPAVLVLSACQEGAPITQRPVSFTMKNQTAASRVVRHTDVTIRTYKKEGNKRIEITGATCDLESAEMSARITSPAIVNLPVLKGRPTRMNIECGANDLSFTKLVSPQLNGTAVGGASPAGLLAAVVSTAIVAGRDQWSYVLPAIILE